MVDIKEQDNLITHLSYILIMWCNDHQGIQKPGPLTGLLMKYFDYFRRRCPKPMEEITPAKPLSGIEHLMESRATQLLLFRSQN